MNNTRSSVDEIEIFKDNQALLENAPEKEQNMFKIPKVIN